MIWVLKFKKYITIKLHSFVHFSPRDVHRIVDKLNNALCLNNAVQYIQFFTKS